MARKRDFKKEYVRREEIAKAKGYKSYYDYRLHEHGRVAPATRPPSRGARRERLTGRRGGLSKLYARLEAGEVEMVNVIVAQYDPPEMNVQITTTEGDTEEYKIRGKVATQRFFDDEYIDDLVADDMVVGSPNALSSIQSVIA